MHIPFGMVSGHFAHDRRHRAASRISGQSSDRTEHEFNTEKLPQGFEWCMGSDCLRAGSPDGRR